MGACPECDGLGTITFFDPRRVVAHPGLSLASGAIKGWDRRNQFYSQMLTSLAAHFRFDVEAPFEKLPEPVQTLVLHGTQEKIPFSYLSERGRTLVKEHAFEGILPSLERRYKETESLVVREELAKYLNTKACPSCGGTRLRPEARHVKIDGRAIFEVSAFPMKQALEFFRRLELEGSKQAIAEKSVNEIIARLNFLNNVGLDYLALDRAADPLARADPQEPRLPHRAIPLRRARDRRTQEPAPFRPDAGLQAARGAREQSQEYRPCAAGGPVRVRHRRLGLGQIDAHQRHALSRRRARALRLDTRARRARLAQGAGVLRQGGERRPEPDRPHPPVQPGPLHGAVHADPRAFRGRADGARARLRAGT